MKLHSQNHLKELFKDSAIIDKVDERGYYISEPSSRGMFYLYDNGIIKDGAMNNDDGSSAFWPTHKKAEVFYAAWKVRHFTPTIHRSCGTCKLSTTCPARAEIENEFLTKFTFIERLALMNGPNAMNGQNADVFWGALAEVCSRYDAIPLQL